MKNLYEKVGCIHLHTDYSDGSGSVAEVIEAGRSAGLDYLMFTDHFNLDPIKDGYEGWHGDLFALFGYEHNDVHDENHYMIFGIDNVLPSEDPVDEYVRAVAEAGGLGIIAHPDEIRDHLEEYPPYPWTNWDLEGFDGIEIWNQMSHWMEGLTRWNKFWRAMHPRSSLNTPTNRILKHWDDLNHKRRIGGIGGVDAHQHIHRLWFGFKIKIFAYKVQFNTIRTHLLFHEPMNTGDHLQDTKNRVINAIRTARCFISNYKLGDARGFRYWATHGDREFSMGQTITHYGEGVELHVIVPERAVIRFVFNGERSGRTRGNSASRIVYDPGVYRVEVYHKGKGWIYSNHIRIESERSPDAA